MESNHLSSSNREDVSMLGAVNTENDTEAIGVFLAASIGSLDSGFGSKRTSAKCCDSCELREDTITKLEIKNEELAMRIVDLEAIDIRAVGLYSSFKTKNKRLEEKNKSLEEENALLKKRNDELDALKAKQASTNLELEMKVSELKRGNKWLQEKSSESTETSEQLKKYEAELISINIKLKKENEELTKENEDLKERNTRMCAGLEEAVEGLKIALKKINTAELDAEERQIYIGKLEKYYKDAEKEFRGIRQVLEQRSKCYIM